MSPAARAAWALGGALAWGVAGCSGPQRVLAPEGPAARELAWLWWVLFTATAVPAALTLIVFIMAVLRGRRASRAQGPTEGEAAFMLAAGAGLSGVIVVGLLWATFQTGRRTAAPPSEPVATVRVVGHMFWWEVEYLEAGVVGANEVYVPAGQPVRLVLESGDVIHSFWVPQLAGKVDMIPGRQHHLWLLADGPGLFRGQCAEFCGTQHARMAFWVQAEPPEAFAARMARWAESGRQRAQASAHPGARVFREAGCALCHRVGVGPEGATGSAAPDLTHLASRASLAAGTLPNTREWLRAWIVDPRRYKPGVRMPPAALEPPRLEALLDYLETLD